MHENAIFINIKIKNLNFEIVLIWGIQTGNPVLRWTLDNCLTV